MKTIAKIKYIKTLIIEHTETGAEARRQRQNKGVSLRALGRAMGISAPYLSDLERGRRNWTIKRMRHFEHTLETFKSNGALGI